MKHQDRILLVSSKFNFTTDALKNALIEDGFGITTCGYDREAILEGTSDSDVIILYLDAQLSRKKEILTYIQVLFEENDKVLATIGSDMETEKLCEIIPKNIIDLPMIRPVNIRNLIHEIHTILNAAGRKKRYKILLIDDDSTFLQAASRWLKKTGFYDVTIVNSGVSALNYLDDHLPDLILLDYEMPIMKGPEVLKKIRANLRSRDIPVFFLTGRNEKNAVMEAMREKPEGYLLKTDEKQIIERLNSYFGTGR